MRIDRFLNEPSEKGVLTLRKFKVPILFLDTRTVVAPLVCAA